MLSAISASRRALGLLAGLVLASAAGADFSGELSLQTRWFVQPTSDPRQDQADQSLAGELSYFEDWDQRKQRFAVTLNGRLDSDDGERSRWDINELSWRYGWPRGQLLIGVDRVFWGVTEALHLIDIVNQTSRVESPDGEDKLGQPMLRLTLNPRIGTLDFFLLPRFREQRLPGSAGRLRGPLQLVDANPDYESKDREQHLDLAFRYSHYVGPVEFALSHFAGTERNPLLRLQPGATPFIAPTLVPFYYLTDQTGLELTLVAGNWLWKLEAISKRDDRQRYFAATGGFEYSWFGIAGSNVDIGLIGEYQYDGRDAENLLASASLANDDLVAGSRLALNDFAGSELLALLAYDRRSHARIASLEASRRLGQNMRLSLEARFFSGDSDTDALSLFADEDYWQLELTRYF